MSETLIINSAPLVPAPPGAGVDEARELRAIAAESIGWWPLGNDAYFHAAGGPAAEMTVINIVGLPQDVQEGGVTLLLV